MTQVATQFVCECGRQVKPADVENEENSSATCVQCGTDAPLLFADDEGNRLPYTAEQSPEMQAASDRLSGIDSTHRS